MSRIGLIGAGNISQVHADVLAGMKRHTVTAVIDPNFGAAERRARTLGAQAFASVEAALTANAFDRAHVLVPPDLHAGLGVQLLQAGKPVLLEKPLAASQAESEQLLAVSTATGTALGVNQNFVHHPAFLRLRREITAGGIGTPSAVICTYNVPLRQLAARQFSHWMFRRPANLLLEQAVHPLSQIRALAGPIRGAQVLAGPAIEIAPGLPFVADMTAVLDCPIPAQLRFAVGQSYPFWQIMVVGSDGVGIADILAERTYFHRRTRWMEPVDLALSGMATGRQLAGAALSGLFAYVGAMAKLRERSDGFFHSMRGSIGAFHDALDAGVVPELDGHFGAELVVVCEEMAAHAMPPVAPRPVPQPAAEVRAADIAVLGGTGFIGTYLVQRLVAEGRSVVVMARNPHNLPAVFADPLVRVERGDIGDGIAVARAIEGCSTVINLAHGGGGANFEAIRHAMVGGAETVARACQDAKVRRLIHVGSIASLYLGPQRAAVTGKTPPDPQESERADYARAKVLCDRMLLEMHRAQGLPVVILRPGLVVGEGTSPFHSGVGLYNNDQHCIGWNAGRNPLPFVLAEDVAAGIILACAVPGIEGRCYNLAGDVCPSARDYTAALAEGLGRPLRYHPQSPSWLWLMEVGKWGIKRATGRAVAAPSRRDFLSRGMRAQLDCSDAKADLGWRPNGDPAYFRTRAILVHRPHG